MAYESGKYYWFISHAGNGQALSVYGNSQVSQNRNVIIWEKEVINDQSWLIDVDFNEGFARIKTALNLSYALNIWFGTYNKYNCDIYTWANNLIDSKIEIFTINAQNNLYRIRQKDYDFYLTALGKEKGADVRWQERMEDDSQVFKLVEFENDSGAVSPYGAIWPLYSQEQYPITSGYRTTARPNHDGVDMAAPLNTPIYAIYDGIVSATTTEASNPLEGVSVRLNHDFGTGKQYRYIRSYYLHMSRVEFLNVRVGGFVKRGTIIGYVNNTGDSFGNHLHLGTRYNTVPFVVGGGFYEGVSFINPEIILP